MLWAHAQCVKRYSSLSPHSQLGPHEQAAPQPHSLSTHDFAQEQEGPQVSQEQVFTSSFMIITYFRDC